MAVVPYTNRPDFGFYLCFNADPNDPAGSIVWTDLTSSLKSVSDYQRGKEYQLGASLAANPTIVLRDVNEYLNSNNTSSPYYPNVVPYRQILMTCLWPNNGNFGIGAGNMFNASGWHANKDKETPYDPTFDSLSVGSFPTWMRMSGSTSPNAQVSATNPFSGVRSLSWSVVAGTNIGVSVIVRTMPGRVYTCSGYVRQSAANTLVALADAPGATSTSTTVVNTYVRLSTTFTARFDTHQVFFSSNAPASTATNNLDSFMMEAGSVTPSAFVTTGPVVYPLLRLFARAFNRLYADNAYTGYVQIDAVDQLAALAATRINTDYITALLALRPDYFWPLNGSGKPFPVGPSQVPNAPPMNYVTSKSGSGLGCSPAQAIAIPGDPGAVGFSFPGTQNEPLQAIGAGLATGGRPATGGPYIPASTATPWGVSFAAWVSQDPRSAAAYPPVQNGQIVLIEGGAQGQYRPMSIVSSVLSATSGQIDLIYATDTSSGAPGLNCIWTGDIADGVPRLIVGTVSQDATNTTAVLYSNGFQVAVAVATNASLGGPLLHPATGVLLGAVFQGIFSQQGFLASNFYGTIARPAVWNRALSAAEVTALWTGGQGNLGELAGTRIARHITASGYAGATRISTGTTPMTVPSFTGQIDLLSDSQNSTGADLGALWAAADGAVVFEGRNDRYLRLTSSTTIGQSTLQYLPDVSLSTDDQYLYVDVQVLGANGSVHYGGKPADITAAGLRFFGQPFSLTGDFLNDLIAQEIADWIFYTHNGSIQRVGAVNFDPASNPALWPLVLNAEIGQRWTFTLSTCAANGGAGLTNSFDAFVEQIAHSDIDADAGTWTTSLWLSPVAQNTAQSQQPWILGDATWGILGSTTRLAP